MGNHQNIKMPITGHIQKIQRRNFGNGHILMNSGGASRREVGGEEIGDLGAKLAR